MHLINDIDLVLHIHGRILYLFANQPNVIYTVIARCIHLIHIDAGIGEDGTTILAAIAGIAVYGMFTVHGTRENLCERSLTGSSRTAKKVGVTYLSATNLILKRSRDSILPHDIVKVLRSPFPV